MHRQNRPSWKCWIEHYRPCFALRHTLSFDQAGANHTTPSIHHTHELRRRRWLNPTRHLDTTDQKTASMESPKSHQTAGNETHTYHELSRNPALKRLTDVQSGHGKLRLHGIDSQHDGIAYLKWVEVVNVRNDAFVAVVLSIYPVPVSHFLPANRGPAFCLDNAIN
jgi:hypothetical protein